MLFAHCHGNARLGACGRDTQSALRRRLSNRFLTVKYRKEEYDENHQHTKRTGGHRPYSQAIAVNGMLFASGQIPLDPKTGTLVEGGIEAQAKRVMQNIKALLEAAGTDFSRVVKTTCFLRDMNDFACLQ